jgi:hypothetical protein
MDCQRITFVLLCCIVCCILQTSFGAEPLPTPVGKVIWIKGTLKAIMPNKEERLLQKKSILYLHDALITDATSQAEIGFTDQTLMTLKENTRFNIDKYQYDAKSKSTGQSVMSLVEGGFRTITGAVAKNTPDNYAINTPVATIGVRGTEFQVFYDHNKLYVGYYSGTPCVTGKKNCKPSPVNKPYSQKPAKGSSQAAKTVSSATNTSAKHLPSSKTLCLNKNVRFVKVDGPCADPEPLSTRPPEFNQDLLLIQEFIEPFNNPGNGNGMVSSFCIK